MRLRWWETVLAGVNLGVFAFGLLVLGRLDYLVVPLLALALIWFGAWVRESK